MYIHIETYTDKMNDQKYHAQDADRQTKRETENLYYTLLGKQNIKVHI